MREYRLATKGKQTIGALSALQLSNHAGCRYTYAVGGVHYSHADTGCGDGRSVGANLTVTYLPTDPGVATTGDAGKQLRGSLLFILCAPTFLAVFYYAGRRLTLRSRSTSKPFPSAA